MLLLSSNLRQAKTGGQFPNDFCCCCCCCANGLCSNKSLTSVLNCDKERPVTNVQFVNTYLIPLFVCSTENTCTHTACMHAHAHTNATCMQARSTMRADEDSA